MERRDFLKLALGFAAGAVALAESARAAPIIPQPLTADGRPPADAEARPAVTTGDEVERLSPEQVHWRRRRYRRWRRRHWGWRRRHWAWHRRRWRSRRRYWRRRYYW